MLFHVLCNRRELPLNYFYPVEIESSDCAFLSAPNVKMFGADSVLERFWCTV